VKIQRGFVILPFLIVASVILVIGYVVYQNISVRDNASSKPPTLSLTPTQTTKLPTGYEVSPTSVVEEYGGKCYENDKYFVVDKGDNSNFLVKYKETPSQELKCLYQLETGDYEITNGRAFWYIKLVDNYLLIDGGTGPPPRGLYIYDLEKRDEAYSGSYSDIKIETDYVEFWKSVDIEVTNDNCPDKDYWEGGGLGTAIEELVKLEFSNMKEVGLKEFRCSPRQ